MNSLLEELSSNDDSRIGRSQSFHQKPRWQNSKTKFDKHTNDQGARSSKKYCHLCRASNRPGFDNHYINQCRFIPESERRRMQFQPSVRFVETIEYDTEDDDADDTATIEPLTEHNTESNSLFIDPPPATVRRVATRKSPRMQCFYGHIPISLLLDTGAESNIIS